jgi:hypothetical protein
MLAGLAEHRQQHDRAIGPAPTRYLPPPGEAGHAVSTPRRRGDLTTARPARCLLCEHAGDFVDPFEVAVAKAVRPIADQLPVPVAHAVTVLMTAYSVAPYALMHGATAGSVGSTFCELKIAPLAAARCRWGAEGTTSGPRRHGRHRRLPRRSHDSRIRRHAVQDQASRDRRRLGPRIARGGGPARAWGAQSCRDFEALSGACRRASM